MQALRAMDSKIAELFVRYDGVRECEGHPFVPSEANVEALLAEVSALRRDVEQLERDHMGPAAAVLVEHFKEWLDQLEARLLDDRTFPNRYIASIVRRVNSLVSLDPREPAERARLLREILTRAPEVLEAVRLLALRAPAERRLMLFRVVERMPEFVTKVSSALGEALAGAPADALEAVERGLRDFVARAEDMVAAVRSSAEPAEADRIPGLDYPTTLRRIYGVELEELLSWYRDEVEACRERLWAVAREIDPGRDPFRILEEDLGPYGSPDELLRSLRQLVDRAREATLQYITLPAGERCDVWPVPDYLRDAYPWGGYFAGSSPLEGRLSGAVFINVHNYKTVTRGWAILNAIHECYPGHHAHFVKTAAGDMPLTFKVASGMISRAAPHSEGLCVRSETLLQDAFDEPVFRLFVAYRRLHTATRVWADLLLHHFGDGAEAAIELYQRYLQFDRNSAQGQVYSQQLHPGYFTVYYYGLKKMLDLEAELGWPAPEFTEAVFSVGKVSMNTVRRLLHLPEEERRRITSRFSD